MLVLTRKTNEQIIVWKDGGDEEDAIVITVIAEKAANGVKIGIEAAPHMLIARKELVTGKEWERRR